MRNFRRTAQLVTLAGLLVSAAFMSDVRPAAAQHGGGGHGGGFGGHGGGFGGHGGGFGGHGGGFGGHGFGGHGGFGGYGSYGGLGFGGYGFYPGYGYGGYGYPYYGAYGYDAGGDCYLARRRVVGPDGRVRFRRVEVCR